MRVRPFRNPFFDIRASHQIQMAEAGAATAKLDETGLKMHAAQHHEENHSLV